ncbi:MAG TPA: hypothetical protein DHW47_01750 [Oscillibacter sp.]|nr:hypothetical protein [Oscillibacter sp.]
MWKKRLVSMAMALVLAVSLLPTAAWAWSYSVGTFNELKTQLGKGGTRTIEVTGTIEVTETLVIPAEAKITISGGTLKRADSFTSGCMFRLDSTIGAYDRNKASLTLENITVDGGGVKASEPAFSLGSNAFLTLKAGAVIQNHVCTSPYEGTMYVAGGVLTMEAGSVIRNNTTAGNGGGVNCGAGSFIMRGGTITGNTAAKGGGGVYSKSCPTDSDSTTDQGKGFVIGDRTGKDSSGVIRIEKNKLSDGTANNVCVGLYSKAYGNIDTSANPCAVQYGTFNAAKSYIGVSAEIVPSLVVKHTNSTMQAAFRSDNGAYALTSGSDGLWLKGAEDGTHTHCVCGGNYKADSSHFTHNDNTAWTGVSSLKAITEAGNYYLLNDVEVEYNGSSTLYSDPYVWQPVNGVKLCLNGHSIIGKNSNECSMIEVNNGGTFDLTDCKTTGKVTHGEDRLGKQTTGRAVDIGYGSSSTTATFNLWGGSITGNFCNDSAGGVAITSGTFNMYGGTITGNTAGLKKESGYGAGGGVYVGMRGTFNLYRGEISENTAVLQGGGGVYVYNTGKFTMHDGTITRNNVTLIGKSTYENSADYGGGGVLNRGTFTMKNGTISSNTVVPFSDNGTQGGGGVYNTGTFTMENGTLTGNKALNYADRTDGLGDKDACGNGGGLYNASGATAKIENAVITENISSARRDGKNGEGAGIFTKGTLYIGTTSSSKVEIIDNEARLGSDELSGGGGVCVRSNNVKLTGQVKIYDNTSTASSHPDKEDNLYVGYDNYRNNFTFSAAGLKLTGKDHIGITTQVTYAKVQITNDNANAAYFYPDSNDYQIVSENGKLYRREAQFKATIHLGEGMTVSVKPNGGVLSEDGKTLTFESVTNIPYFEIAPDGDHYLPESYKDAIKDMNSPLSASWYSNTRVQLSGYDSKLTKELELWLPDATAKDAPAAPTGLGVRMPDEKNTAYGFITGTTKDMEYRKDGDTEWTRCSYYGNTTKVPLDKRSANSEIYVDTVYYVRYRDTETQKMSEATTVTVPRYTGVVAVPVPRTDMVYRNRYYFVFEGDIDYYDAHYKTVQGSRTYCNPGTYTVKVKPEDGYTWVGGGTDPVTLTVTIARRTATASDFEVISYPPYETPYTGKAQTYEIRFAWPESPWGHRLAFANSNNKLTLKYKVGDTNTFVTEPVDVGTYTLYIDVPDDPNFNATTVTDEGWTFTITPADMKAPTGVTGVAATKEHPTKGQLTGLGTDMEYRVKGSETWTAAIGNTVDVTLNTENGYPVDTVFEVRYKADKNHDTSSPAQVTVKAYQCVEHVYGETLVSDEASHWYQCTVCGAKTGIAAHSYTDKKFDGNGHWAVCACGAETHHDKHSLTAKHNESQHWQECVCGYKTGETAHELTSKYDTAGHWQECECGYATDKTDHSMESKSSADGHWDACACGYKTDVAAHAWTDKFDTQNHWQECSGCGYKTGVTAHSLTKNVNETQHQVKCESCGYKTEWENHTGGTATCTAKAVCSVCGESYGELAAHVADSTYKYNGEGHWTACATCGTPMSNQEAHTGGTADCQHKAVCDVCGQPYGELDASNHTGGIRWVQTAETHQAFYLCCGAAAGAEANHSWNDESVCTECGYGCAHTGGTATCTALAVCDICGHTYGDLLPHDYRWVIDQEATTEATGLKHEECTACGDKRSEGTEIPKRPRHSSSVSTPDIQPILTADEAKSATDYSGGIYGLTFRASTGYGSFKGVKVNGKTIGAGNYIAEENGGTEIYLKAAYLQTLAPGKYTMTVMTESGEVTTEFTVGGVMTAPKTADAGALVYLAMALSSYTGTALVARKRRKEF